MNMPKNKRKLRWKRLAALTAGLALVCCALIMGISVMLSSVFQMDRSTTASSDEAALDTQTKETKQNKLAESGTLSMHFNGVGDNLLHDVIFVYYEEDYGNRDFLPIFENTLKYSRDADLAYINFETICAGDAYGLSGYPNFNGPLEMIDTLAAAGYDWFSTSSNHSMDAGADGLLTEMNYIEEKYPDIVYTGTHTSEKKAAEPVVVDVNGIKVGLASFTYGLNGYTVPEGQEYLVDVFMDYDLDKIDYSVLDERLDALQDVSDIQIVSMHWGVEYEVVPNSFQEEAARHLNQKGVEVIIGSHPHVIQPVAFIQSQDQTTLCYYSLGNFLSAQDQSETMVGGMADFTLEYNPATSEVSYKDVKFIPTVTYISPDLRTYRTYTISEYNDDIAASQYVTSVLGLDCSVQFVKDFVKDVVGAPEGIEIVYE